MKKYIIKVKLFLQFGIHKVIIKQLLDFFTLPNFKSNIAQYLILGSAYSLTYLLA